MSLTFVQLSFQLFEVALLQTDLQVHDPIGRGTLDSLPSAGHVVCFFDLVRGAGLDWRSDHGTRREQRQERNGKATHFATEDRGLRESRQT